MDRILQWCFRVFGYPMFFDIMDPNVGSVYLRRYFLIGSSSSGSTNSRGGKSIGNLFPDWNRAVYLHVMYRPDKDRCHHDHPWPFTTLVLWGGYEEEITKHELYGDAFDQPVLVREEVTRWNRPGVIRRNPAMHTHRVSKLPNGKCYTLVLRGQKERTWGFWSGLGLWTKWTVFDALSEDKKTLWCEDQYTLTPEDTKVST